MALIVKVVLYVGDPVDVLEFYWGLVSGSAGRGREDLAKPALWLGALLGFSWLVGWGFDLSAFDEVGAEVDQGRLAEGHLLEEVQLVRSELCVGIIVEVLLWERAAFDIGEELEEADRGAVLFAVFEEESDDGKFLRRQSPFVHSE